MSDFLNYYSSKWDGCVGKYEVYGLDNSIKRAKFPMSTSVDTLNSELTKGIKSLAQSSKGEGHDQWLTGIVVQMELKFTVKAWTEEERYKFMSFISSQSTMHRITKFNLDDQYIKYVDPAIIAIMKKKVADYNDLACSEDADKDVLKERYLEILYSNPCGFQLTAGITTNYRALKTVYAQRKNHRLPEWVDFCKWIESLPASYLITGE